MLCLDDITAGYGDITVLKDVSITVPPGQVVALLGPNGAGKTTLLRVASGLLRPKSGNVQFNDRSLVGKPADAFARSGICYIPEGRAIFRSMTVKENLLLYAPPGHESEALETAAEVFPVLGERLQQRAGTMSGGQQQMLALMRAYLANPSLVLLDEVSLGLAPKIIDTIFEFLRRLAKRGIALLVVEQYVSRALDIADFVFLLNQGTVVFAGKPDEVNPDEIFRFYTGAAI
jgi:branched-chain amino acid transport system ATP-binding protein